MSGTSVRHLARDFLEWSGGFPPEDQDMVTVYVDYACPRDVDQRKAWRILNTWMSRQGMSRLEKAEHDLLDVRGELRNTEEDYSI